jgi:hypothetical protein
MDRRVFVPASEVPGSTVNGANAAARLARNLSSATRPTSIEGTVRYLGIDLRIRSG